jgi:hypothetical protein
VSILSERRSREAREHRGRPGRCRSCGYALHSPPSRDPLQGPALWLLFVHARTSRSGPIPTFEIGGHRAQEHPSSAGISVRPPLRSKATVSARAGVSDVDRWAPERMSKRRGLPLREPSSCLLLELGLATGVRRRALWRCRRVGRAIRNADARTTAPLARSLAEEIPLGGALRVGSARRCGATAEVAHALFPETEAAEAAVHERTGVATTETVTRTGCVPVGRRGRCRQARQHRRRPCHGRPGGNALQRPSPRDPFEGEALSFVLIHANTSRARGPLRC